MKRSPQQGCGARDPGPGVVVGLAPGVVELERDPADLEVEPVRVGAVRVPVVDGPLEPGHLELPRG